MQSVPTQSVGTRLSHYRHVATMKRKSSRRDFLKGRSAAENVAHALEAALPEEPQHLAPDRSEAGGYQIQVSRRAMACEFEIRFNAGQYENATEAALQSLDLVDRIEDQLSVFRSTSEICRINQTAAAESVPVERELFELLRMALHLHAETDGAFDITSAPLWESWGFARREGRVPDQQSLAEALTRVGSQHLELDAQRKTIRFRQPGIQLNLGSIGKGFALDRCAARLQQMGIDDFLIHGGSSSVLARGGMAREDNTTQDGWTVGIRHPLRPQQRLAEIRLCDRALATSGSWAQSFVHQGRRLSHLLDPRTGRPAEGVLSATAIAPNATLADGLSTAFFVMGPEAAIEYCRERTEIGVVLACPVRHGGGLELKAAGLGENEWKDLQSPPRNG